MFSTRNLLRLSRRASARKSVKTPKADSLSQNSRDRPAYAANIPKGKMSASPAACAEWKRGGFSGRSATFVPPASDFPASTPSASGAAPGSAVRAFFHAKNPRLRERFDHVRRRPGSPAQPRRPDAQPVGQIASPLLRATPREPVERAARKRFRSQEREDARRGFLGRSRRKQRLLALRLVEEAFIGRGDEHIRRRRGLCRGPQRHPPFGRHIEKTLVERQARRKPHTVEHDQRRRRLLIAGKREDAAVDRIACRIGQQLNRRDPSATPSDPTRRGESGRRRFELDRDGGRPWQARSFLENGL